MKSRVIVSLPAVFFSNLCHLLKINPRIACINIETGMRQEISSLIDGIRTILSNKCHDEKKALNLKRWFKSLSYVNQSGKLYDKISFLKTVLDYITLHQGRIAEEAIQVISDELDKVEIDDKETGFSEGQIKRFRNYAEHKVIFDCSIVDPIVDYLLIPSINMNKQHKKVIGFIEKFEEAFFTTNPNIKPRKQYPYTSEQAKQLQEIVSEYKHSKGNESDSHVLQKLLKRLFLHLEDLSWTNEHSINSDENVGRQIAFTFEEDYEKLSQQIIETLQNVVIPIGTSGMTEEELNELKASLSATISEDCKALWVRGCTLTFDELLDHNGFRSLIMYRVYSYLASIKGNEFLSSLAWDLFSDTCNDYNVYLHPDAKIEARVCIGRNVLVQERAHVCEDAFIGDNVIILPSNEKKIMIGENAFLLKGSKVIGSVTIGANCLVAENKIVSKDLSPNTMYPIDSLNDYTDKDVVRASQYKAYL